MKTVELSETGERDGLAGSDGAFYTRVTRVEARCHWCRRWAHAVGLYYRKVPSARRANLVCRRHVVRRG